MTGVALDVVILGLSLGVGFVFAMITWAAKRGRE